MASLAVAHIAVGACHLSQQEGLCVRCAPCGSPVPAGRTATLQPQLCLHGSTLAGVHEGSPDISWAGHACQAELTSSPESWEEVGLRPSNWYLSSHAQACWAGLRTPRVQLVSLS